MERNIDTLNKYLNKHCSNLEIEKLLSNCFAPSKTAQNCLNFITKTEEDTLQNIQEINCDIVNMIKLIYLMINENFDNISNEDLVSNLFLEILPSHNVDSLSKSFY